MCRKSIELAVRSVKLINICVDANHLNLQCYFFYFCSTLKTNQLNLQCRSMLPALSSMLSSTLSTLNKDPFCIDVLCMNYVCICVHMHVRAYICTYVCMYVCVCQCMSMYACKCICIMYYTRHRSYSMLENCRGHSCSSCCLVAAFWSMAQLTR